MFYGRTATGQAQDESAVLNALRELLIVQDVPANGVAGLSPEQWPLIVREARFNRVGPLLLHRLRTLQPAVKAPANILAALSTQSEETAMRWLIKKSKIDRLGDALAAAGIPGILLKGAQLAVDVYPYPALRPMGDIDLLVREADLSLTPQVLASLGYVCLTPYDLQESVSRTHALPIYVDANGVAVDLHWTLEPKSSGFQLDLDGLWHRAHRSAHHPNLLALSIEDQILHLALHAVFHSQNQSGWIVYFDFLFLSQRHASAIDWQMLCERAKAWRCEATLYTYLAISKEFFGAQVPTSALESLGTENGVLAAALSNELLLTERKIRGHVHWGVKYIANIKGRRPRSGVQNVTAAIFRNPIEHLFRRNLQTPTSRSVLLISYPLHWIRILAWTLAAMFGAIVSANIRFQFRRQFRIMRLVRLLAPAAGKPASSIAEAR